MLEKMVALRNGSKIIRSSPYFYSKKHSLKVLPMKIGWEPMKVGWDYD